MQLYLGSFLQRLHFCFQQEYLLPESTLNYCVRELSDGRCDLLIGLCAVNQRLIPEEETAKKEGFTQIAAAFHMIGAVEKTHGDRLGYLAELLEKNQLFVSNVECSWMCLKCGHIHKGKEAPKTCPVCQHEQGYFIRLELAPYTGSTTLLG